MTGSHRVRCVYWNAQIYYTESRAFVPNFSLCLDVKDGAPSSGASFISVVGLRGSKTWKTKLARR